MVKTSPKTAFAAQISGVICLFLGPEKQAGAFANQKQQSIIYFKV
jgi:hypothetical protein